jgi:hypothetical protein
MTTLTKSDVSRMSQTIDRALRHCHHARQLSAAQQRGDMAAQLEHSLHVADTRIGMAKSPSEADHWRTVHSQVRELIDEAGFVWRSGRLVDPSRGPAAAARSMAKSFASPARAAEYSELRSELMRSMAQTRDSGDYASRMELISLRDELTRRAQAEGLRLDDRGRFVPARA